MRKILTVAVVAVLGCAALAVAQGLPFTILSVDSSHIEARMSAADPQSPRFVVRRMVLTGNVALEINGVVVKADRAVVDQQTGEIELQGNVRLTPPSK